MPVHREDLAPCVLGGQIILPQPPVLLGMVVGQYPHRVAVVIHIDHIRLVNGADGVLAVPQRVIHIPAYP